MGVLLMSNFTTQVRYLCESFGGEAHGVREIDNQIKRANRTIFDFDYPIFDNNYKEELELKIIRHYYMREIGAETFGLWQLYLCDKMNEIMPYYNQLYTSTLLKLEPLINLSTANVETENENYTLPPSAHTSVPVGRSSAPKPRHRQRQRAAMHPPKAADRRAAKTAAPPAPRKASPRPPAYTIRSPPVCPRQSAFRFRFSSRSPPDARAPPAPSRHRAHPRAAAACF